jgi:hypothetical protein
VESKPALTLAGALDFIHAELATGDKPILPRIQRELAQRAVAAAKGDEAVAAKKLGLAKPLLKKLLTGK